MGFRSAIRQRFPDLEIMDVIIGLGDIRVMHDQIHAIVNEPSPIDLQNVGTSDGGVAQTLIDVDRIRDVTFFDLELTSHSRGFLLDSSMDAVIDKNPPRQTFQSPEIFFYWRDEGEKKLNQYLLPTQVCCLTTCQRGHMRTRRAEPRINVKRRIFETT